MDAIPPERVIFYSVEEKEEEAEIRVEKELENVLCVLEHPEAFLRHRLTTRTAANFCILKNLKVTSAVTHW